MRLFVLKSGEVVHAPAPKGTRDLCSVCAVKRGIDGTRAGAWLAPHYTVVCDDCGTGGWKAPIGNYDVPETRTAAVAA